MFGRVTQQNLSHPMVKEEERLLRLLGLWKGHEDA